MKREKKPELQKKPTKIKKIQTKKKSEIKLTSPFILASKDNFNSLLPSLSST